MPVEPEHTRARKRQRTGTSSNNTSHPSTSVDHSSSRTSNMRLADSDQGSETNLSSSPEFTTPALAGPSSVGLDTPGPPGSSSSITNGHTSPTGTTANGNGFLSHQRNGSSNGAASPGVGNGVMAKHGKSPVARVNPPGTLLYDDSNVDREEFIRLVVQSLRDVGYK